MTHIFVEKYAQKAHKLKNEGYQKVKEGRFHELGGYP